ncbi:MAG: hypothetical protein RL238_3400 [Actinomycetota bacterium]|jgi:GNAT superfamily N-acetyltransferase
MTVTLTPDDAGAPAARAAMGAYFAELDRRFTNGFDPGDALDEAASAFNPPAGVFLLGRLDGEVVACGGVQWLDDETAEIKRMWVHDRCRGMGVGRRLLEALEAEAVAAGRTRVVLDTNGVLAEAIAMYRRLGYADIERYNDNPYAQHWFAKHVGRGTLGA